MVQETWEKVVYLRQ